MSKYTRKRLAVVFDVDDVLFGFVDMLCFLHNQLNGTVVSSSHFTEYDMRKIDFKDANGNRVTGADLEETFIKYEDNGLYALLEPLNRAPEALNYLTKCGYHIILMTARKPKFELQTIATLAKFKMHYNDLLFVSSQDKAKMIRKLGKDFNIVAFADDKASTTQDVFESTNVNDIYLVNQPHNMEYEVDEDIRRVGKLFDIIQHFKDLNE